jgi:hypothetical protein
VLYSYLPEVALFPTLNHVSLSWSDSGKSNPVIDVPVWELINMRQLISLTLKGPGAPGRYPSADDDDDPKKYTFRSLSHLYQMHTLQSLRFVSFPDETFPSEELAALTPRLRELRCVNSFSFSDGYDQQYLPQGLEDLQGLQLLEWDDTLTMRSSSPQNADSYEQQITFAQLASRLKPLTNLESLQISTGRRYAMGPLSADLAHLSKLQELHLSNTCVTGSIPTWLPIVLPQLHSLDLSGNDCLTGTVPTELGHWTQLESLNIQGMNGIRGPIPSEIGNLTRLKEFVATGTALTGSLPPEICHMASLERLMLQHTQLTGTLPSCMGGDYANVNGGNEKNRNMPHLTTFHVQDNALNGTLPIMLGLLSNLQELQLQNNNFSGQVPPSIANLTQIVTFDLSNNQMSGTFLPSAQTMDKMEHLKELILSNNQFTGPLPHPTTNKKDPSALLDQYQLTTYHLDHNQFSGDIPWNGIAHFTMLQNFNVAFNNLSGSLTSNSIGKLSKSITHFQASHNKLNGSLPAIAMGSNVIRTIDLSSNSLIGPIPEEWFNNTVTNNDNDNDNTQLEILHLHNNTLSGAIPDWISSRSLRSTSRQPYLSKLYIFHRMSG